MTQHLIPHSTNTISFFDLFGNILGTCFLPNDTTHHDRINIAILNNIPAWNHYAMHDSFNGMTNSVTQKGNTPLWITLNKSDNSINI